MHTTMRREKQYCFSLVFFKNSDGLSVEMICYTRTQYYTVTTVRYLVSHKGIEVCRLRFFIFRFAIHLLVFVAGISVLCTSGE